MNMMAKARKNGKSIEVRLFGASDKDWTPATTMVEVEDGDTVLVSMENRQLVIIGNQTNIAGATVEGVTSSKDESGSNVSLDIAVADGKLSGLGERNIKTRYTPTTLTIERTDTIATFTDKSTTVFNRLDAMSGVTVGAVLEIAEAEDGSMVIFDVVNGNGIAFREDGIHIYGDIFMNEEKVSERTQEEGSDE